MKETTDLRDAGAVCASIGVTAPDIWRNTWPQSAASFAPDAFYLDPEWIRETCATLRFGAEVTAALAEGAAALRGNLPLERLLWHCRWLVCDSGFDPQVGDWPELPARLGPAGLMLYGLLTLSGFPHMLQLHGARGIAREDTIESLASLQAWTLDFHRLRGVWCFPRLPWLEHHLRGHLHKLGRLEYLPGKYYHPFRWYRHADNGQVIALAEDGCLLRPDGQFASADGGEVREGLWKSRFIETAGSVTGHPVSPCGYVLGRTVTLDMAQWHEVLRKGDPVVTVHIPATGPMDHAQCGESFRHAVDFYQRHFPELKHRAFTCNSWLLDPQFELLEPPPPNISAFLREWYLHPTEGAHERGTWQRVFDLFGGSLPDWENAPQDTRLRQAIVAFARKGGRLRGGGSVLFGEDLEWGKQVYRTDRLSDLVSDSNPA